MLHHAETGQALARADYDALVPGLRVDLINHQYDLRTKRRSVIVQLEGDDRAGCEAAVDRLQEWMDVRYLRTRYFGRADDYIRERPVLWRYWREMPIRGRSALFLNAWTLRTIAARVRERIDDAGFRRRLEHVCALERMLVEDGCTMVKLWLHLPKDEYRRRLKAARQGKRKAIYVDDEDRLVYEHYDRVLRVSEEALEITHTPWAPWIVVDGTDGYHRDATAGTSMRDALARAIADDASTAVPSRSPSPSPSPSPAIAPSEPLRAAASAGRGSLAAVDLTITTPAAIYDAALAKLQRRLNRLSRKARRRGVTTILAFEGWDAAGKGGAIRRLTSAMSARDYDVVPIAAPNDEELAHHYLWRFWRQLPRAGRVLVFDRTWYGRVLVERIEGLAPSAAWQRAYAEINDFEAQLVEKGFAFAKFWLHISAEEQLRRFEARRQTAFKNHKITDEDLRNREKWDAYRVAVEDMVAQTHTPEAPWHLISANDKRSARLAVLETTCDCLERAIDAAPKAPKRRRGSGGR